MDQWTLLPFRIPDEGPDPPLRDRYSATEVRLLRVEVPAAAGPESNRYFKAMVQ